MSRPLALLLVVLTLCSSLGCQSGSPEPIGSLVGPIDLQRIGYTPTWSRELLIPNEQALEHVAVLGDQLVVIESPSRITHALALRDGSRVWSSIVGNKLTDLVGLSRWNDRIIINTSTEVFYLDAANGDPLQVHKLPYTVQGPPAYSGDTAIFGAAKDRIFTFDMPNAFQVWAFGMGTGFTAKPLALDEGRVFVADLGGSWAMVDIVEQEQLFRGRAFRRVTAAPVANNRTIFIASEDKSLYAINRFTGDDEWIYRTDDVLTDAPVVLGNWLYLPLPESKEFVALDPGTGRELWRLPNKPKPLHLNGQRLLLSTTDGLIVVDNETGSIVAEVATKPLRAAIAGPNNSIFIIARGGRVERFDVAQ